MLEDTAYRCLSPEEAPELGAFDIAAKCQPLLPLIRDFVDYVPRHDGSLLLVRGWAVGLNVYTTIDAIRARTAIRSVAATCSDPGEILTRVNQILITDHTRDAMVPTQLTVLSPDRRTIQIANAGAHGFLLDRCGNLKDGVEMELPLGVCEDQNYSAGPPTQVVAGDIYASCNDGILEAESTVSEFFGQDGLVSFLDRNRSLSAQETIEKLFATISQDLPRGRPSDGLAIAVVKIN
ncbi:PP2C family protein-serine/threonine phosphatase [Novipirellula sp. SH528]|uniref:PP2C family protein-serine/threonine phosphatase n=1 Tax=Novipirellula sp. SH528 TaxID=3454466 RepID=UPI003FA0BE7E